MVTTWVEATPEHIHEAMERAMATAEMLRARRATAKVRGPVEPRSGEPTKAEVAELQRLHDSEWRGAMEGIRILGVAGMHEYVEDVRALVLAWCPDREPRLNLALSKYLAGDYAAATLNAEFALTSVHIAMGKPELEDN